jgi:hypothetical protein
MYTDDDEESDEDADLPSYLREQSSDEEDQALYSQNKKNAQGVFTSIFMCICTHIYRYMNRCLHVDICIYVHVYICINIHIYAYIYIPHLLGRRKKDRKDNVTG